MNRYLLIASFGEDEMKRDLAEGEDRLLDLIETKYLNSGASLEVYVLDGAVDPITTDPYGLLIIAEERQKRRKTTAKLLDKVAGNVSPKFVVVVSDIRADVAFGRSQVEAIENFVDIYTAANGGPLSKTDAHLVRQAIVVRDFCGSSYSPDNNVEVNGDDARFDQAFAKLTAGPSLKL